MFGECESESPRVGSPWDSLLSSGASTPSSHSGASDSDLPKVYKVSLPKLVPEAEEVRSPVYFPLLTNFKSNTG
jgi:hypothetical protein